jgi:hypothetical protein
VGRRAVTLGALPGRSVLSAVGHARLALVATALLLASCGGGDEPPSLPLGKQIAATATLSPAVHVFAEDVVARVDVVVDRDHVDPERVQLEARFQPYEVKESAETREDRGRITLLRYEYLLHCLGIDCIPEVLPSAAGEAESGRGERRSYRLPPARVVYGETRTLTRASWPELVSVSRLRRSDVPRFGLVFEANVNPLPEPDYRVEPRVLGAGLAVGALALLALPATFLIGRLRRRQPPEPEPDEPELPPLERALRLVETREDGDTRREALEVLAGELDAVSQPDLAKSARTLAWSRPMPTTEATGRLVEAVRDADSGD